MLRETTGNIVIVTHGGILRGWLCRIMPYNADLALELRQPWGGITTAELDEDHFRILHVGLRPSLPDEAEIRALYDKYHTPQQVILHSRAVAERAADLVKNTNADPALLRAAALLHDLCRTVGREHPQRAAAILDAAGWPQLAEIVAQHHDLNEEPSPEA